MKTNIHPYLIARFMAVQAAFMQPGFRFGAASRNTQPVAAVPPSKGSSWDSIIKKDEDDEDGEGGGGTIRGNRGKNAVTAAMKKLTRSR